MDSTSLQKDNILEHVGGTYINSLSNILHGIETDYEVDTIGSSQYYSLEKLPPDIKDDSSNLLIVSLNAQSILAKFNSIDIMLNILNGQNISPDLILIQESWLLNDDHKHIIHIDGYNCTIPGMEVS